MKTSLAVLMAGASFLSAGAKAPEVVPADHRWETLRAINWVENPTNHARRGRHGELGPYQFRPATWQMHTKRPFIHAAQRSAADEIAVKHYEWIKRSLERGAVDATPFNIALAWNCGVSAVLSGKVPEVSYHYATRVGNLVETLKDRSQRRGQDLAQQTTRDDGSVATGGNTFNLDDLAPSGADEAPADRFRVVAGAHNFLVVAG